MAILTDLAIPAENIDEAKAEEAGNGPKPVSAKSSGEEVAAVNAALARSLAQLRVKRRRHV